MRTVIIGAGAAGLTAAGFAADVTDEVILIEHSEYAGKKLGITGKGRCNITNIAPVDEMITQYPKNAKFLYSALNSFTNNDIIELLEKYGVKTKVERGGRVFPASDKARDVVNALKRFALKPNVKYKHADAKEILTDNGAVSGVKTDKGTIKCDKVILCTGGKSYPSTGSDGSGYKIAQRLGHTIIEPKPSLVPIVTRETWTRDVMGLTLKNVRVRAKQGKKTLYEDMGELLFTHFGVSGPTVLSMSARLKKPEESVIEIDLKPALDEKKLTRRIIRDFEKYSKRQLINALDDLLPKSLIPVIIDLSGVDKHKSVSEITKGERAALVDTMKRLTLHVSGFRPIEEAIVTSGGIKTGEINPSTMESKLVKNLYFAGEIIDADGYTGGYNLQMAYSTGYLAGINQQ